MFQNEANGTSKGLIILHKDLRKKPIWLYSIVF